ncbi:MAG TPA: polysaccharide deacetylase family protein, partial [Allocoleopsis sp.]
MKLPRWIGSWQSLQDFRRSLQPLSPKLSLVLLIAAAPVLLFCVKPAFSNRGTTELLPTRLIAQTDDQAEYGESQAQYPQDEQVHEDDSQDGYAQDGYAEGDNAQDSYAQEGYAQDSYAQDNNVEDTQDSSSDAFVSEDASGHGDAPLDEGTYDAPASTSDDASYPAASTNTWEDSTTTDDANAADLSDPVDSDPVDSGVAAPSSSWTAPTNAVKSAEGANPVSPAASPAAPSPMITSPDPASPAPAASPTPDSIAACPEANLASSAAEGIANKLAQRSNVALVVETALSNLASKISRMPFPGISGQARMGRVPVIMYHDILPEKQVFFDVTPEELAADFQLIQEKGLTPITLDQLVEHLATGKPLPEKPILLTFDDGYQGHYTYVYPLLKQYNYPAVFAIYPKKVGTNYGRSSLTWEQLREMAANPLVTIASHSVTHPSDLREFPDRSLRYEVVESKRILETELGITIKHFVYPEGKYDERVENWVRLAGYSSALTMNDEETRFAGQSHDLLSIDRIGQSELETVVDQAYGGPPLPPFGSGFNFNSPITLHRQTVDEVPLIFATGGRPTTIHADSRYQVKDIMAKTDAVAAVDGGFFSLELLTSNDMMGPVFSHNTNQFVPGSDAENAGIQGRPLVLISPNSVKFIPYDPTRHNTLEGIRAEMPDVTDAFVAAAWLVKDGQPQPAESFGKLYSFDAERDRAFWGIDQAGQAVVGVSGDYVDSVTFGEALSQAGLRDAVMLDSGASAALAYEGQSLMSY